MTVRDAPTSDTAVDRMADHFLERRIGVALLLLGVLAVAARAMLPPAQARRLRQASVALGNDQHGEAARISARIREQDPDSPQALLIAGLAAEGQLQPQRALDYFTRLPDNASIESLHAQLGRARRLILLGRLDEARQCLLRVLQLDPNCIEAHSLLCELLQASGRGWESLPHVFAAIQSGQFGVDHLLMAVSTESLFGSDVGLMQRSLDAVPSDPLARLGKARNASFHNQRETVERLLRQLVSSQPENVEAQALYGRFLHESDHSPDFLRWGQSLPPEADEHPDIWYVRGLQSLRAGEQRSAVRSFWEAVRRNPNHLSATHQLSLALHQVGEPALAQLFQQRSASLLLLEQHVREFVQSGRRGDVAPIVNKLESLGRLWEASAWCEFALWRDPDLSWPREVQRRLYPRVLATSSRTDPELAPTLSVDLSSFELPASVRQIDESITPKESETAPGEYGQIAFVDSAAAADLDFEYFDGSDDEHDPDWAFEPFGGGVGVLDYDRDGWPDLVFPQGRRWPLTDAEAVHRDRLYRNLGNGRFADVSVSARVEEAGNGQGVASGDFNNDGFPDLCIANVGANAVFINNGDGTFSDVTEATGTGGDEWTASCVIADLNGDTWPDLYCANYLGGPDILTRECRHCDPREFPAAQDRLSLNLGDGTFRDVTAQSGLVAADGKGLGVVAADLDGTGRISLYVANDTTPNFLFLNQTQQRGRSPLFVESGVLAGAALDASGHPLAGMGIAAGDADEDGRVDLFVTNYHAEANTLYFQTADGIFVDGTGRADLIGPGYSMLGFGTQFLDADLDGRLDLFAANGHVFDLSSQGTPYEMPPQFYRNLGRGRFAELSAELAGPYFQQRVLGRAVARLDWNRDGREDVCVTHLDRPVALLTNTTPDSGRFLRLILHGVLSDRDAIGTVVRLTSGGRTWSRQLTAGDGYMASNARELTFGTGHADRIDRLRVEWPSGEVQELIDLPTNIELALIEGTATPFRLRSPDLSAAP